MELDEHSETTLSKKKQKKTETQVGQARPHNSHHCQPERKKVYESKQTVALDNLGKME